MTASFRVEPAGPLSGSLVVPGDKSISHRALILGAIARGTTRIQGLLEGEDVLGTRAALVALGVPISRPADGLCTVQGVGLQGLRAPPADLDLGNSGTAMRLLVGLLAAQPFSSRLVGDESLSRRPMGRVVDPLLAMGADIGSNDGRPPLEVRPVNALRGIDHASAVASAQVKSCLLLAGLYAEGRTRVSEPHPSRDHTERMLRGMGYPLDQGEGWVAVDGPRPLQAPGELQVPGDVSSAAFWLVAGSIVPDSDLLLRDVGINPLRDGIIRILRRMGARIDIDDSRVVCGEPVADLRVRSARLNGTAITADDVPSAIDEMPALFVAAAFADGDTTIRGARELRVKESDRIAVMAQALRALGVDVEEVADGATITGGTALTRARVDAAGDHRCAMALAIAGAAGAGCEVTDVANVATSYPTFADHARAVGLPIEETDS